MYVLPTPFYGYEFQVCIGAYSGEYGSEQSTPVPLRDGGESRLAQAWGVEACPCRPGGESRLAQAWE